MKNILIGIFLLSLFMASGLRAEAGKGGSPGPQLQMELSARVMGMGGAFSAVADDPSAIFYNPAGTAQMLWNEVDASYRHMDFDRRLGYVAASFNARETAKISVGWLHASAGEFAGRDGEGELTGEDLSWSANTVAVAFAMRVGTLFKAGATGKYFITKLANMTANTVSFDLGTMLTINEANLLRSQGVFDEVRVALVVKGLGGTDRWNTGDYWGQYGGVGVSVDEDYPLAVRGGVSAAILNHTLVVACDLEKYAHQDLSIFAGGEYSLMKLLILRAGYADGRAAFGAGFYKKMVYYGLKFDYAFASGIDGEAANHLFSIGFEFR